MTMWQAQIMEEDARNATWEEMWMEAERDGHLYDAMSDMNEAISHMDNAVNQLGTVVGVLKDTPMEDQIASVYADLEKIQNDLYDLKTRLYKGEY